MKLKFFGFVVPLPAFGSFALSFDQGLTTAGRIATLLTGLALSWVMFGYWLARKRREEAEAEISRIHLDREREEQIAIKHKINPKTHE